MPPRVIAGGEEEQDYLDNLRKELHLRKQAFDEISSTMTEDEKEVIRIQMQQYAAREDMKRKAHPANKDRKKT
ncbi:hypothetical protein TWF481_009086 [Arthrobotrys musiformis]|uniref:CWF21 domain-containing protein n=1 Tax=Arthrobotrys musiformis TaxID=47236 RepID=A0AAV9W2L8_9PEZI